MIDVKKALQTLMRDFVAESYADKNQQPAEDSSESWDRYYTKRENSHSFSSLQEVFDYAVNRKNDDLCWTLIRAMVAAAAADKNIDASEKRKIMSRIGRCPFTDTQRRFLMSAFEAPPSLYEITRGVEKGRTAQAVYAAAVSAIFPDHPKEHHFLQKLGEKLELEEREREDLNHTFAPVSDLPGNNNEN